MPFEAPWITSSAIIREIRSSLVVTPLLQEHERWNPFESSARVIHRRAGGPFDPIEGPRWDAQMAETQTIRWLQRCHFVSEGVATSEQPASDDPLHATLFSALNVDAVTSLLLGRRQEALGLARAAAEIESTALRELASRIWLVLFRPEARLPAEELLAQAVGREPHLREALLALSAETMRRRQEILGLDSREQFLHFGRVAGVTDERVEVEIAGFEEPLVVPLALLGDLPRVQPGDLVSLRRAARDSMAMRVAPAFDLGPDWTGTQQVAGRTARGRQRARASSNEEARSPSGTSGDGDSQAKRLLPYLGQWVALVGDQVVTAGPDVATVVGWLRRNGIKADTAFRVPTTEAAASGAAPQ